MKHKVLFWSIMGISLVAGGVLTSIGAAMGGFDSPKHEFKVYSDDTSSSEYANIENLEFELAACDVTIKEGDEFSISGTNIVSEIVDHGETWRISSPKKKWYQWIKYQWINRRDRGEVTVTLPSEKQFEDIEISFAAAELNAEKLSAKNLEISGGAGSATIDTLLVTEELDLSVGAGQLIVENGEISGEHSISCGAGEMDLNLSKLQGDVDASCGMGEINLTLPGAKGDYGFDYDAIMGSVQVADGGTPIAGSEEILANLDLSCGMGAIHVDFQ